jgi:flagellar hook-associated protein 2
MTSISALGVGSGLDLNGLLDDIKQDESKQLAPIAARKSSYEAKISAYGALKSALADFQDAAHALTEPSAFQAVASSVTGDALTATTNNTTPPGDYQIDVTQRAQASSVATLGVADDTADLGAGTIDFTLADGRTLSVSVEAGHSSLADIRDAINDQNGGVRASIINDGGDQPYRLVLRASATGEEAAVSDIAFGGDLQGSLQLDDATRQQGTDAKATINGIDVRSASNRIEDAIQGVTLDVTGTGSATLQVTRDEDAIRDGVHQFVDAYNKLVDSLDKMTSYDADSQQAGILLGDSTTRTVASNLQRTLGSAIDNGGAFSVLSDAGISLQLDGTLEVDDDQLQKAITEQPGAVRGLFAGAAGGEGMAGKVDDLIGKMTDDQGLIGNATDSLNQSIDQVNERYSAAQKRIDATLARYRKQFSQLDSMIANMKSTSSYLTQQFDALSATLSQGK